MFVWQITALCVIPMTWQYWVMVVGLILGGSILFNVLSFFGQRMLRQEEAEEMERRAAEERRGYLNLGVIE